MVAHVADLAVGASVRRWAGADLAEIGRRALAWAARVRVAFGRNTGVAGAPREEAHADLAKVAAVAAVALAARGLPEAALGGAAVDTFAVAAGGVRAPWHAPLVVADLDVVRCTSIAPEPRVLGVALATHGPVGVVARAMFADAWPARGQTQAVAVAVLRTWRARERPVVHARRAVDDEEDARNHQADNLRAHRIAKISHKKPRARRKFAFANMGSLSDTSPMGIRRAMLVALVLFLTLAACSGGGAHTYTTHVIALPVPDAGLLFDIAVGKPGVPVMRFQAGLYRWNGDALVPVKPAAPADISGADRITATPDGTIYWGKWRLPDGASEWLAFPPLPGLSETPTIALNGRFFAFVQGVPGGTEWTLHRLDPGAAAWSPLGVIVTESVPALFPDGDGVWFQLANGFYRAENEIAFAGTSKSQIVGVARDGTLYLNRSNTQNVYLCGAVDLRTADGQEKVATDGKTCVDDGFEAEVSCSCGVRKDQEVYAIEGYILQWFVGTDDELYAVWKRTGGSSFQALNHLRRDLNAWEPVFGGRSGGVNTWRNDGPNFWVGGNTQSTSTGSGGVTAVMQTDIAFLERD